MPKRFFPFYLLLVLVAGHFTNELFVRGLDPGKSDKMLKIWTQPAGSFLRLVHCNFTAMKFPALTT